MFPNQTSGVIDQAVQYLELGWKIFQSRKPIVSMTTEALLGSMQPAAGQLQLLSDLEDVQSIAQLLIATGATSPIVLTIRNLGHPFAKRFEREPDVVNHMGEGHFYFAPGFVTSRVIDDEVELCGTGSFVFAPPSINAVGAPLKWTHGSREFEPVPKWLQT